MTDTKCQNLILHDRRMVKDSKVKAITGKKRKMWIFFPIYYLTASVLLSFYICLLIKPSTFLYKSCHLIVLGKREFTVLYHSVRKRTQRGILQTPTFSKETIYLSSYNGKLTFISFWPFFLPLCPSLSLPLSFCIFPLPFVKLFTSNPITLQSVFSMLRFSLGNVWKCWVSHSPWVDCPKYLSTLPLGDSLVPDTLHE